MSDWTDVFDINASIRIIRHISGGIYRNPANAMKELVVNAFDSGATKVDVRMGGPTSISKIVISDNGQGLPEDDMVFSFKHVGSSLKRLRPEKFPSSRPIVGQFGIGLLAAAHASRLIHIQTTPKAANYTLDIEIDLTPFFKFEKSVETLEEFTYGSLKYKKLARENKPNGTTVTLAKKEEKPEAKRFWGTLNKKGQKFFSKEDLESERSHGLFEAFAEWIDTKYANSSTGALRGFEEFLWHLGLILPVQYLPDGPLRKGFQKSTDRASTLGLRSIIRRMKNRIGSYDFHVYVDGIEVKRPILLPSSVSEKESELKAGEWAGFPINYKKGKAQAEGYLFFQPYRVRPMELRGIYPRLKGVGVGQYDNTLFKVFTQNPVLAYQLSGELNLRSGFDDALNLDRTGFIETDSAYIDLVQYIEQKLSEGNNSILVKIRTSRESRVERRTAEKLDQRIHMIKEHADTPYRSYRILPTPRQQLSELKNVDSDYSQVKISHSSRYVAVAEPLMRDPLLVSVLLAIDGVLRDIPHPMELETKLKDAIRRIFAESRSGLAS